VDGVADEVADGGGEQISVAEHLDIRAQRRHDLDASRVGNQPRLLDGLSGRRPDVDQLRLVHGVGDLQT